MKFIVATISLVLVALIGGLWFIGSTEFHENEFATYKELVNSQLIDKGWVPQFIPKSAYAIKESHYVDSPYINVEFHFAPKDLQSIELACSKISTHNYSCAHAGDTVFVQISNGNHAKIISEPNNT